MKKIAVGFFSLLLLTGTTQAQTESEKLAKLPKVLIEKIGNDMPGWAHQSITPIEGSKNVIVEQWESGAVTVKVAVTEYKTNDEAFQALNEFKNQLKTEEDATIVRGKTDFRLVKENLPVLGDGGFTWDIRGSDATAFSKQNLLVFVSIASRPKAYKEAGLSKEFAAQVADVLTQ